MFRAQQNAFDDVVLKATDENLTSENWEYIMDVCDKVGADENGAKDAVAAMIKRLAHRNANVQLYTLELANATSQNCGIKMHRELASRSFTEALLRLAADRNTHQQVKAKILERMSDWAEMFAKDPDLGIMEQAYMKLKTQNPHLQPPSQPPKTLISESDRRREDEELQMALALSIKEKDSKQNTPARAQQSSSQAGAAAVTQSAPQPVQPGTTAATVSRVRALYDFNPSEPGELQFRKGDIIAVIESVYKDWWKGSLRGQTGIFPLNYVEKLQDPTADEVEREAQMEAEVFAEMKNVEKLLALLSTSSESGRGDVRDNEEITTLYHSTLAIRPKLIELIGKYSQKKDDFTQLNEKYIKAKRDYESLLEASISHPPQPTYGRPAYTYGAPPPAQQAPYSSGYGNQPPPSQDPRYYSPGPSEQQYPPANGPQPFYFVPPSQQNQGQSQQPQSQPQNNSTDDLYSAPPPRTTLAQRPASIAFDPRVGPSLSGGAPGAIPQELATGTFDSPVDGRTGYAHPPPAQHTPQPSAPLQQHPSQPYEGYTTTAPSSQRPTSSPQYTQPVIPTQHQQQQKPQSAIYTLPSQQPQRLPSGGQQPSDPYGYTAQQGPPPQSGPPAQSSTSPVQLQQQKPLHAQTGYPPTAGTPIQQPPSTGQSGGYQAYQAYNPTQGAAVAAGAPPAQQRWSTVPPAAGTAPGHAAVPPAGGRGEDEGFYR